MAWKQTIKLNPNKKISSVEVSFDNLNSMDFKIIKIILESESKLTISQIREKIEIAPINLWKHLKSLESFGIIKIPSAKKGKPKYPELVNSEKVKEFLKAYHNLMSLNGKI